MLKHLEEQTIIYVSLANTYKTGFTPNRLSAPREFTLIIPKKTTVVTGQALLHKKVLIFF